MADGASKRDKKGWAKWTDEWVHRVTIPALLGVTAYMVIAVRPPSIDLGEDPSFADVLINNRAVVLAAWTIVIDGAIFLFASLIARTAAKEWANKAGPVGTGDDPAEPSSLAEMPGAYVKDASKAVADIENLQERLEKTEDDYAKAVEDLKKCEAENARLQEELGRAARN